MSFNSLLIDTCTVQRFAEGIVDDYGRPEKNWSTHISDEPCRLVANPNREIKVGVEVVIADYDLFIGDVDVTEQDRIIIEDITYEIISALRQKSVGTHHKELLMRTVR